MRDKNPLLILSGILKIILIITLFFGGYKFYLNHSKIKRLEAGIENLNQEIKLAQEKNFKLEEELDNINNPEYIEKIARKELGLVKPGEMLFIPVEE